MRQAGRSLIHFKKQNTFTTLRLFHSKQSVMENGLYAVLSISVVRISRTSNAGGECRALWRSTLVLTVLRRRTSCVALSGKILLTIDTSKLRFNEPGDIVVMIALCNRYGSIALLLRVRKRKGKRKRCEKCLKRNLSRDNI